jgi:predicted RNA-binding protein with PIN domain
VRWLIDGYNVIRQDPALRGHEAERLESGRAALLRLVAGIARRLPRDDFTVVFDGARVGGAGPPPGRVRVAFSRPPESADDVLLRLARETGTGGVVVSSDHRVQDGARRAGCAAVSAPDFLDAAQGPADPANGGDADEEREDDVRPRRGSAHRLGRDARNRQRALDRLRRAR